LATTEDIKESVGVMSMLNKAAAKVMSQFSVSACTDVTGFGLAGHLMEMAKGSKKSITLDSKKVPLLKNVLEFASMGLVPAGAHKNRKFFEELIHVETSVDRSLVDLMFDPQTSGGLLITLNKKDAEKCVEKMKTNGLKAWIIGEITHESDKGFLNIF